MCARDNRASDCHQRCARTQSVAWVERCSVEDGCRWRVTSEQRREVTTGDEDPVQRWSVTQRMHTCSAAAPQHHPLCCALSGTVPTLCVPRGERGSMLLTGPARPPPYPMGAYGLPCPPHAEESCRHLASPCALSHTDPLHSGHVPAPGPCRCRCAPGELESAVRTAVASLDREIQHSYE